MRLHPVTWLMLLGVALKLLAVGITRIDWWIMGALPLIGPPGSGFVYALVGLAYAAFVEVTFRAWRQLQSHRHPDAGR